MKLHLISFAGPGLVWRATSRRFLREARHTGLFESVKVYTDRDLFQSGISLSVTERGVITEYPKGYGLWIWKPIIIQSYLDTLESGEEYLLYCDVGFSFGDPKAIFSSYEQIISQVASEGPTFFYQPGNLEHQWTRATVLDFYAANGIEHKLESSQVDGGVHFWKNDAKSVLILEEWRRYLNLNPAKYLADPKDLSHESSKFRAHRHDQSLLSLVTKIFDLETVSSQGIPATGSKEHLKPWRKEEKAEIQSSFFSHTRIKSVFSTYKTINIIMPLLIVERVIYDLEPRFKFLASRIRRRAQK